MQKRKNPSRQDKDEESQRKEDCNASNIAATQKLIKIEHYKSLYKEETDPTKSESFLNIASINAEMAFLSEDKKTQKISYLGNINEMRIAKGGR